VSAPIAAKRVGIIGHGADKFTPETEAQARAVIRSLLSREDIVVSGHSPVGGVDIWAEEIGVDVGAAMDIKAPESPRWEGVFGKPGYKARNLDIARSSDEVHVIVAAVYPPNYRGRRFPLCYHCGTNDHIKSGACWTAKEAKKLGKTATWHVIEARI
jgi:hypothetical protein